jgi:hypothetical protein
MKINVRKRYFEWLLDKIDMREHNHHILVDILHIKEFYWTISNDDNRLQDGKELRINFSEETGIRKIESLNRPCSVLEVLVGMMFRFDNAMPDPETEEEEKERPSKWFWEMLENCGLAKYDDDYYMQKDRRIEIDEIITRILSRDYDKDGSGGLFPLKHPKKDQRKIELWYQMNAYIMEKCYTLDA